jgi:hypothetical protein
MTKKEEGKDKSRGGCPNPQDMGSKSYPVRHVPGLKSDPTRKDGGKSGKK